MLELAEPLTPALREVSRTPQRDGSETTTYVPEMMTYGPDTVTVHGMLHAGPRRVTLIEARNVARHQVLGGPVRDPEMERLQAARKHVRPAGTPLMRPRGGA